MDSKLSRWCDTVIEIGCLIALLAAPLFFNTQAQLELAGIPAHDERVQNLLRLLEILNLSLQIGDDLGDWLADLQAAQF